MAISPVIFIGLICLLCGGSFFPMVEAIWLTVPNSGERCLSEEIQANVLVVADYFCIDQDNVNFGHTLDVRVTSPQGRELYKKTNDPHGQFSFITSESGTYSTCLSMHHDQTHHTLNGSFIVSLHWKMGINSIDWDSVAKKENIEGVDLAIRRSTEFASAVKTNIIYLKNRDEYLRATSEKTNKKVAQLSFVSVGVSFLVSLLQVWHLKRFFLKKKLI